MEALGRFIELNLGLPCTFRSVQASHRGYLVAKLGQRAICVWQGWEFDWHISVLNVE